MVQGFFQGLLHRCHRGRRKAWWWRGHHLGRRWQGRNLHDAVGTVQHEGRYDAPRTRLAHRRDGGTGRWAGRTTEGPIRCLGSFQERPSLSSHKVADQADLLLRSSLSSQVGLSNLLGPYALAPLVVRQEFAPLVTSSVVSGTRKRHASGTHLEMQMQQLGFLASWMSASVSQSAVLQCGVCIEQFLVTAKSETAQNARSGARQRQ